MHSRYDIYVERYCKDINIESLAALEHRQDHDPAGGVPLPGRTGRHRRFAQGCDRRRPAHGHAGHGDQTGRRAGRASIGELEGAIDHHGGGDLLADAKYFQAKVMPAMKAVRDVADKLEGIVADDLWPLPTYREMLFIK